MHRRPNRKPSDLEVVEEGCTYLTDSENGTGLERDATDDVGVRSDLRQL